MTSTLLRPTATVTVGAETVKVSDGDVGLDSGSAPYGSATVTVPLVDPDDIELLDPRDDVRATIVGANDSIGDIFPVDDHFPESDVFPGQPGTSRTFDMGLRSREVDHKGKTITLELATDEAILMDYATLVVDSGARAHEASLRAVCDYILGKIGASLASGAWDADVTAHWSARNLIIDPGTAATPGGGYSVGNCSLDPDDTTWSVSPDGDSFNLWSATAADSFLAVGSPLGTKLSGLQEGKTYVFAATGNVKVTMSGTSDARARRLVVHTRVSEGPYVQVQSDAVPNVVDTPTRVFVEFTVPIGCTEAFLRAYLGSTVGQIRWDGFTLVERGPGTVQDDAEYWDGNTPDTEHYLYDWDEVPDESMSTRTAVVERSPELFTWKPGVTAWDFLEPFTSAAGLRLFCDETRTWRLINPAEYEVPGRVSVAGWNATEGTDRVDRSDPNVWCTGVVVHYTWRDEAGVQQEAFDHAGTPGRVLVWEYDRPYPGPGAAAAILARRSGAGRRQDVTALSDWTVTPGVEASITLPATVEQVGTMQSVRWQFTDALMRVGTSGLIDVLPGSIDDLDGTIDGLVGTIDDL